MTNNISRREFLKTSGLLGLLPLTAHRLFASAEAKATNTRHRILTCNILLDLPEQKGTSEDWEAKRQEVCIKVIQAHNPDILCLQEVGLGQRDDFAKAFPQFTLFGYVDPYTDTKPRRFQAAKNVILYSTARYEQVSAGLYWLSDTPLIAGSRLEGEGLPRHVTWVRLKDRVSQKEFRILNTHWALKQSARLKEAQILVAEAGLPYSTEFPQLLTGDLNSESGSSEHKILVNSGWKDTYMATHQDARTADEPGAQAPSPARKIDFVYAHGAVTPLASELFREQKNGVFPSDHPFVSADVAI